MQDIWTRLRFASRHRDYAQRAIMERLRWITLGIDYTWFNGFSFHPCVVVINLTERCNLQCEMCDQSKLRKRGLLASKNRLSNELTSAQLYHIIDQIASSRLTVFLTGGEPLLHPDVVSLVAYIRGKSLMCVLNTNGSLLREKANDLVEADLNGLVVSLDGTPSVHDQVRGVPGTFQRVLEGIEAVQLAKNRKCTHRPSVRINSVVTPSNHSILSEILPLAERVRADGITFQHLEFKTDQIIDAHSRFASKALGNDSWFLEGYLKAPVAIEVDNLVRLNEALRAYQGRLIVRFHPPILSEELQRYYHDTTYSFRRRCFSPWLKLQVLPNGDVSPCLNYVAGNIKDESLKQIWNGPRFRHFRRQLKHYGTFPGCFRCCDGFYR